PLESTPRDATHWSTREMAKASGLSDTSVLRIWHAFGLQPHRAETFKLSNDPQLVEKVRDIAGLYLHPPERALVLCTDEKAQIQALDRTQPIFPMRPGMPCGPTTTADTAPLLCSPPSTSPAARSSASFTGDTARPSSATSSIALTRKSLTSSTCTWSSTTTAPTRRR